MNINEIMDKAKGITGSDYRTAKQIGITRAAASQIRSKGKISNEVARKLAELVGTSPLEVIAAAEIAKHPERRTEWEKWVKVACIVLAISAGNSADNQELSVKSTGDTLYIMRIIRRIISSAVRTLPWMICCTSRPRLA